MREGRWIAALWGLLVLLGDPIGVAAAEDAVVNVVQLHLQISGLGEEGCEIEIKPGHPGCQFAPITKRIEPRAGGSIVRLPAITVAARSTGADLDCTFAITVTEPGQKPRTSRRGLRLSRPEEGGATPVQALRVLLSAPSIATREDSGTRRR